MIKEGKFGVQEAICVTTISICTKVFFTSPGYLTRFVGTAGWYMTLISNATTILAFTFIYILLKRFPGKNIIEVFNISMGRIIGFIFSFIFAAAFLLSSATFLREFVDILTVFILPDSSLSISTAAFVLVTIIAAFLGLESIVRVSKLFAYPCLLLFILVLLLSSKDYKFTNLLPIMGFGFDKTLFHGMMRSSAYDEVIILAVFANSLQGINHIKKAGYISLIFSGLIISLGLLSYTLVFPYPTNQELTAPVYTMVRLIQYGIFIERLDPIFLFLWSSLSFIVVSILFYASVSTYCKMFRIQDKNPVILPMAILLFIFAMLPKDLTEVTEGNVQILREYGWAIFYVLPFIALIAAVFRRKKGEETIA